MKMRIAITIMCGIMLVSFYAMSIAGSMTPKKASVPAVKKSAAGYTPDLSPRERKIVNGLQKPLELLVTGTEKVLELDGAKKRLEEQKQEHDKVVKDAQARSKRYANSKRGGSGSGSSGGYGRGGGGGYAQPYRGGGGYNPYAGRQYAGSNGYPYGTNSNNPSSSPTTTQPESNAPSPSPDTNNSGNIIGPNNEKDQAAEAAKQAALNKKISDAIDLTERISRTMKRIPTNDATRYELAIEDLQEERVFSQLNDAVRELATQRAQEQAAAEAKKSNETTPSTPTAGAKKDATSTALTGKAKELDTALVSAYRSILPHVMFAATKSNADSSAQELLRGDMQQVGQAAITAEAQKRSRDLMAEWQKKYPDHEIDKATLTAFAGAPTAVPATVTAPVTRGLPGAPGGAPAAAAPTTRAFTAATAAATAGAGADQIAAFKNSYRQELEKRYSELKERRKRFAGFNLETGELGTLDNELVDCRRLIKQLQ
jgi:hypothetical protein